LWEDGKRINFLRGEGKRGPHVVLRVEKEGVRGLFCGEGGEMGMRS